MEDLRSRLAGYLAAAVVVLLAACTATGPTTPGVGVMATAVAPKPQATAARSAEPTPASRGLASVSAIPHAPAGQEQVLLATTTSTQDSGLLDVLLPDFKQRTGYQLKPIAVGTGQALELGKRGEADIMLVHAPSSELPLVTSGDAIDRRLVMHNDFVVVGPRDDPAGIKSTKQAIDAFKKLAESRAVFVSRGDNSGTHVMEKSLWTKAAVQPPRDRYLETGSGMGQTLDVASEKGGYTLTDRATFLARRQRVSLEILLEGDAPLLNVYHVMLVNPEKHPKVNAAGARAFADYLVSREIQDLIGTFGRDKYGQALFFPDAGRSESDLGL